MRSRARASVQFGVFGYCIPAVELFILGSNRSQGGRCSPAKLGYQFDSTVANVLQADRITDVISRTTTAAFVINPIATGLTFLAFLVSLFMLRQAPSRTGHGPSRWASFFTFGIGILAALLTTVAFLINVIVVAIVRHKLQNTLGDSVTLSFGNAVWMTLGASVALWIANFGAIWGVICGRRRKHAETY